MGEPFSIAANIVAKANVKSGDKAVIFGAGTIGVAVLQVLKKQGIKVLVTDIADVKLKIVENFGADTVVNSTKQNLEEEVEKFSEGGVEAVIDYVDVMSAKISHHMIVDAIMRRDEKEAVHLVTEHLAEFYKIRDYFPFIVKEPIIE